MPRKVRELIAELQQAGFNFDRTRGSHRQYKHPRIRYTIIVSGGLGDDVKRYQEQQAAEAMKELTS